MTETAVLEEMENAACLRKSKQGQGSDYRRWGCWRHLRFRSL